MNLNPRQLHALQTEFSAAERDVISYAEGFAAFGSFKNSLMDAIKRADLGNQDLLAKGYPELVDAWRAWTGGNLGRRWRTAFSAAEEKDQP